MPNQLHRLSLAEAIQTGRISHFSDQEQARGVGPIDRAEFDGAVSITGAFAESPIPEPAYLCLLGMLTLGRIAARIPIKHR